MAITIGSRFGHYEILAPLGAGGMGEVYRAKDTRLDREVAIKVLSVDFANNAERVRRFEQEARATSALNHPNILTVYDIGRTENGTHYIATEYVEGETLHQHIRRSQIKLREVLDIVVQVASALAAAHQAGIVHRDIKPENIMVRPDGYAKVLDFGLAKLSEKPTPTTDSDAATISKRVTDPGTVMGTVQYMSPEQARGKPVDARSDIFSLATVVYEMVAGRAPFAGESSTDVLAAILEKDPLPLARFTDQVPQELQRIITKCLRKNRDERYQTMKDVLLDLKELRDELALEAKIERSIRPGNTNSENQRTLIGDGELTNRQAVQETATATAPPTSSAEYLISEIKQHKRGVAAFSVVLLAVAIALAYWLFKTPAAKQIESIAVMPFANESVNQDIEYLSDGMTETLISSLSNLPNLNVKPRSSVFRYKGKDTNPKTVAKELNVQSILNGRVVQRGQDISLFVELIDVSSDKVVWSETYNRKSADLVNLQADIARDVSGKIKSKLSGEDIAKVTKTYTANPEAYQLYLRGNFYLTKYTEEGCQKAIEYYEKALAIDPKYALAYHGIAAAYDFANGWYLSPREAEPKAKAAALKALELDDTLAETHYLLGKIVFWYEWDWTTAEREWRRAHELDAGFPPVYPSYLSAMGRSDEAVKAQNFVQQRLPLDLNVNLDTAALFLAAGRYDQAIEQSQKALELDPNFWWTYQLLGMTYERKQQYEEAVVALEKASQAHRNRQA